MILDPITLDFETYPIRQRPDYPPRPVGLAAHFPGLDPFYLACGHTHGANNCDEATAREWLWKAWTSDHPLLFHNAKFDLAVATEAWGFPKLPWQRVHDTMFLAFLADPHARSLGLKDLADDLLGIAPDEKDAVADWVTSNSVNLLTRYPEFRVSEGSRTITKSKAGAWIFAVPPEIVGPYAIGDVTRTRALFDHLLPIIERNGMMPAYDRERELLPILLANEAEGMRVDLERLEVDIYSGGLAFDSTEDWLRRTLGASGLNFDADQDVASVLVQRGIVHEDEFPRTAPTKTKPSGQMSMSKENLLPEMFTGASGGAEGWQIASMLGYRNRLATCLNTFMTPWRDQARKNAGRITTNWNQTRGGEGGTRTGRPSTDRHNFLNISKSFIGRDDGYVHPDGMPDLPLCRGYILPDEGEVFLHRDFSGQEMRVFAHFEQGHLFRQYQADPKTDPHAFIGDELRRVAGREIARDPVKTLNFQSLYGGGVPALQKKLRCTTAEAQELKKFHNDALPGRVLLNEEIKRIVRRGDPIRTWGGRLYYPEQPGADGRSKEYKLINYLIQGSAADLTKQAIIDWHKRPDRTARFLVTVYDEIDASAAIDRAGAEMEILRSEMEKPRLTVPMLSDGKRGPSWGSLVKEK